MGVNNPVATQVICPTNNTPVIQQANAGGTLIPLLQLNSAGNIQIDPNRDTTFVTVGNGVGGPPGSTPRLLMTGGSAICFVSYDAATDMLAFSPDISNNLFLGDLWGGGTQNNSCLGDVCFQAQDNQQFRWFYDQVQVAGIVGGRFNVQVGGSSGINSVPAGVGGPIYDHTATVSTTDTNGTEDTLYTDTIAASTLQNVGDKLTAKYGGSFVGSATATRRLQVSFGGSVIFDTTALVSSSASTWSIDVLIMCLSSTSILYDVSISAPGLATTVQPAVGTLTGLTLSNSNVLLLTGASNGTGAASGDISANIGTVSWQPAGATFTGPNATSPLNLAPLAWYKADVGAYTTSQARAACTNGSSVGLLLDQSGNNLHLVNNYGSSFQPLYETNILNSLPGILFNGTSDFMQAWPYSGLNFPTTVSQPFSVYMVANVVTKNSSTNKSYMLSIASGNGNGDGMYYNFSAGQYRIQAGTPASSGVSMSVNTSYVFQALFDGSSSTLSLDGGSKTTVSAGSDAMGSMTVGQQGTGSSGGTNQANMYLFELIVFPYQLSSPQESALFTYFTNRWGIAT